MATNPITSITVRNFGPFETADIKLSPGLNVILGDNSTGKSQLMKLLYAGSQALKESARDSTPVAKRELEHKLSSKLVGTFRPLEGKLGRLARRARGTSNCDVIVKYGNIGSPLKFSFSSRARSEVKAASVPNQPITDQPVYVPPHELLSLGASFISLYDQFDMPFDETWRDTVSLMTLPALKGPRGQRANEILAPFSQLLQGGTVREWDGEFVLNQPGIGNLEAPLLAEGHRKLAMIVRLIATGALLDSGFLFWDEPEANLNPMSQRAVANALVQLASQGVQIFVATHSTFLLREIQMAKTSTDVRYIGLHRDVDEDIEATAQVVVESSDDVDDLEFVAALEAEAAQADRYFSE